MTQPNNCKYIKMIQKIIGSITKPSLIFYLSLNQNSGNAETSTVFNSIPIGPTNLLQSSLSPLFKDINLTHFIGKNSSNVTIYNYNTITPLYNTSVSTIYRLETGDIAIAHAPLLKQFDNFFGLPSGEIELAKIVYGSGEYLNKSGFVGIATGETTTKTIFVYFN